MPTDSKALESLFGEWQRNGTRVVVSCIGQGMRVVFTGRIGASRKGTWTIGNGRAGLVFDIQYATGQIGDPGAVPSSVRDCVDSEFSRTIELFLETGDECWFGEVRSAESATPAT